MKEIPILFSTEMVQALQRATGPKEQTRRLLSHKTILHADPDRFRYHGMDEDGFACFEDLEERDPTPWLSIRCPYGQPGDVLWVRETFYRNIHEPDRIIFEDQMDDRYREFWKKKPSIHMPRSAARIFLEVTGVKAERLQDISEADAIAEGIEDLMANVGTPPIYRRYDVTKEEIMAQGGHWEVCADDAIDSFRSLWQSINAARAPWDADPWVWAVTFQRRTDYPSPITHHP